MNDQQPTRLHRPEAVDLALRIEDDLKALIPSTPAVRRRPASPALPDYVQHHPNVDDVGRLSAEALAMSYEEAAKRIEDMGTSLIKEMRECEQATVEIVRDCERVKAESEAAVEQCKATAQTYRSQAKELFDRIQNRAILAAKVRDTCATMIEELK